MFSGILAQLTSLNENKHGTLKFEKKNSYASHNKLITCIAELPCGPIKTPVSAEHYGDKNMG